MATPQVQQSTKVPPYIEDLARWAIEEVNKNHGQNLVFKNVIDWEEEKGDGVTYTINLLALNGEQLLKCTAKVLVRHNTRTLLGFDYEKTECWLEKVADGVNFPIILEARTADAGKTKIFEAQVSLKFSEITVKKLEGIIKTNRVV